MYRRRRKMKIRRRGYTGRRRMSRLRIGYRM